MIKISLKKHVTQQNHFVIANLKKLRILDKNPGIISLTSLFNWRVTVSGQLMFLESYGNCDVTYKLTLLL